jgi:hypothetical protein
MRFLPRDRALAPANLAPASRAAVRDGRPGRRLAEHTLAALERRGLISRGGRDNWRWTALGRAVVRQQKLDRE